MLSVDNKDEHYPKLQRLLLGAILNFFKSVNFYLRTAYFQPAVSLAEVDRYEKITIIVVCVNLKNENDEKKY